MTTVPYDRPRAPADDPGEPGDLRALVARVFATLPRRTPVPARTAPAHPPLLRTET
ncbi:hypothetical protein ABZW47_01965 [Streptomyces sp. NPDC004549]|uniref:hypothetical protein n=1 Tax=unclassified Streptomyces TaxID=2593676 RepID=UPI0033AE11CD